MNEAVVILLTKHDLQTIIYNADMKNEFYHGNLRQDISLGERKL